MLRRGGIATLTAVCSICVLAWAINAFAAVELPEKLKDIPLFPNSKVEQSMDMEAQAMASLTGKAASAEAIAEFYKKAMKEKGWKVVLQAQQEDSHVVHFQKDSKLLHINIQAEEGGKVTCNMVLLSQ